MVYRRRRKGRRKMARMVVKAKNRGLFPLRIQRTYFGPKVGVFKVKTDVTNIIAAAGVLNGKWSIRSVQGTNEFASITTLYDAYRVNAIKLKFFPGTPNDTSTSTIYHPVFITMDNDQDSSVASNWITTTQQALDYDNVKVFNLYKPWKYYRTVPRITAGFQTGGTTPITTYKGGYIDNLTQCFTGGLSLFATGLSATTNYGQAFLTYYITVIDRK